MDKLTIRFNEFGSLEIGEAGGGHYYKLPEESAVKLADLIYDYYGYEDDVEEEFEDAEIIDTADELLN